MGGWINSLSIGKKIALAAGSFLAVTTIAGATSTIPKLVNPQDVKQSNIEVKQEKKTEIVNFKTETKKDSTLDEGKTSVSSEGSDGERTIIYEVTYTDGTETARELISDEITKKAVNRVVVKGTYLAPATEPQPAPTASNCDTNYSGCVPIAYDVDCAGGGGNGPAYTGYTTVVGTDVYGLDRDGDGIACE